MKYKIKYLKASLFSNLDNILNLFKNKITKDLIIKFNDIKNIDKLNKIILSNYNNAVFVRDIKTQNNAISFIKNIKIEEFLKIIENIYIEDLIIFEPNNYFNFYEYLYNQDYLDDENLLKYNISNYFLNINNKENETYLLSK